MRILSIETSCDETSVSVVERGESENSVRVLSLVTSSSLPEHAATGGIIPEKAARRQLEFMLPVVEHALNEFSNKDARDVLQDDIDAIAVTQGPGLIGSLLVGVECAKTLSYVFNKPLIPVNHLLAHLYSNFIAENPKSEIPSNLAGRRNPKLISFPFIGLIVSGGHTDLLHFTQHGTHEWIGGTRDDAVGEALDKIGRRLGLAYPGGPEIEKRAKRVDGSDLVFQSPLLHSNDYDFSYSGLKTEVARYIDTQGPLTESQIHEVCFATQKAAFEVLVKKTLHAASEKNAASILVGGGVAANKTLHAMLENEISQQGLQAKLFFPEKKYTLDNAAMIGAWAAFHMHPSHWNEVRATPEMYFA